VSVESFNVLPNEFLDMQVARVYGGHLFGSARPMEQAVA
jgi:hypothetical protein